MQFLRLVLLVFYLDILFVSFELFASAYAHSLILIVFLQVMGALDISRGNLALGTPKVVSGLMRSLFLVRL